MLQLSSEQISIATSRSFTSKLRSFLIERTRRSEFDTENLSTSRMTAHYGYWVENAPPELQSEYSVAVGVTFLLMCECERVSIKSVMEKIQTIPEAEFYMKSTLESQGYLRFSEFDL
jgi:hypothetical protein